MLTPELVIFDCDGVLVDSEPISNEVLAAALTDSGLPTSTAEALRTYKGRILADVVAIAEDRLGRALPEDFVTRFEERRAQAFDERLRPIEGARETVERVLGAGIPVCVASQGKREKTEQTLGLTGLRELFSDDELFSAYAVARGKPYPDLFLFAASEMGAAPERCVVVEDTALGVTAGVAAGMTVIAYAADSDEHALVEASASGVVHDLRELPAAIGL